MAHLKIRHHVSHSFLPSCTATAVALLLTCPSHGMAQSGAEATLSEIKVSSTRGTDVTGFGTYSLSHIPLSTQVVTAEQMQSMGAKRLADTFKLDASVSDAYNSPAYWDYATVRGFVLDNRQNYMREGLPISAETSISLYNKERIEVLKGTSGIQSGTSAPGGLVNYVVKRPTATPLRQINLEINSEGARSVHVDLGNRFGEEKQHGYRLNVAAEHLDSYVHKANGQSNLVALALDIRINRDSLLEFEIENSHKSQLGVAGLSLTGNTMPAPGPRVNISSQPWSQPGVFDHTTATLRFSQALNQEWNWSAQWGRQRLLTQDRIAFPYGWFDLTYDCWTTNSCDRFLPNGDFSVWDYRSENELRQTTALSAKLAGKVQAGSVTHDLNFSLLQSRRKERFQNQAYNLVGTSNIYTPVVTPADATTWDTPTNRDEKNLEFSVSDTISWTPQWRTWLGLRHTHLERSSLRTDGSRPTIYSAGVSTPWAAVSYQIKPSLMAYASFGKGIESQVVPNKTSQYTNAGQALPLLQSRQQEVGLKHSTEHQQWSLSYFDITRPMSNLDACSRLGITPCLGAYDGQAHHQGLEASGQWQMKQWTLGSSVTALRATRENSALEPGTNGQRPTNVPNWIARVHAAYRVAALPGLELQAHLSHEGTRNVLPDGSLALPAWNRVDALVRYYSKIGGNKSTWTLGIDNLMDKRFFKESPYQYGHIYLFPAAPRTVRLNLSIDL